MNKRIGTFLKVIAAIVITAAIYEFLTFEAPTETQEASLLDASMEKLANVLRSSASDEATRDEVTRQFDDFTEKLSEGDISPEKVEQLAADILNTRLANDANMDDRIKAILEEMRVAHEESDVGEYQSATRLKEFDNIAIKIAEIAEFQEQAISELSITAVISTDDNISEPTEVIIPEIAVSVIQSKSLGIPISMYSKRERTEAPAYVIALPEERESMFIVKPGLKLEFDSKALMTIDSVKLIRLRRNMEKLDRLKILKKKKLDDTFKVQKAAKNAASKIKEKN